MRMRRTIGSLLATALTATTLGVVGIATTATSASAATTVQTRIVSGSSGRPAVAPYSRPVRYGDSISLSLNVEGYIDGAWKTIYYGSMSVTQQVAGKAASTVATASSAYLYKSVPARGNATYTVKFNGGSSSDGAYSYAPTAATYQVSGVQRKLSTSALSGRKAGFKAKLVPGGKTKVVVMKKQGRKYKKFKTLRTNSKGRVTVVLPAPRRGKFYWKITFAGNRQFAASTIKGSTYRY